TAPHFFSYKKSQYLLERFTNSRNERISIQQPNRHYHSAKIGSAKSNRRKWPDQSLRAGRVGYSISPVNIIYAVARFELGVARFELGVARFELGVARFELGVARFELGVARFMH